MHLVLVVLCAVVLLATSYVLTSSYVSEEKLVSLKLESYSINKKKGIFLAVGVVAYAILIYFLYFYYDRSIIDIVSLLVIVTVIYASAQIDAEKSIIPNKFLLLGLVVRVLIIGCLYIQDVQSAWDTTLDCLIGATVFFVVFLLIHIITHGICMGDVKLFGLMGLYQGIWGTLNSIFFSLAVSFFLAIVFLILKKKKMKDSFPMGPCIFLGTVIAICLAGM